MIHNTDSIEMDLGRTYQQSIDMKPNGLWYSFNNEWENFCKIQQLEWVGKNNFHLEIDYSKILLIENKTDLIEFILKYSKKLYAMDMIDWNKVSNDYSGIELKNYFTYRRMCMWLYSWDMDSGCIWDLSIIKNIKELN